MTAEMLATALRAAAVFVVMLVVIRLLGKRTVGNLTAFDLIVALILGELTGEIIFGDTEPAVGLAAIVTVAAAQWATSWLNHKSRWASRWLEGRPGVVVRHGTIDRRALRRELMNDLELMAALRHHDVADLAEVKLATVEADGTITILKEDWAEPPQRRDVGVTRAAPERQADDGRSDSPRALGEA
jgi:uncharacterized membrane protein YcaP (DUF421 family)